MVQPWWAALAVPAVVAKGIFFRGGSKRNDEASSSQEDDWTEPRFICERVCTSDKLLKKVGRFAKDPPLNTCVTVCGTSRLDACTEACSRTVCGNMHHVPAWNETCLERCKAECLKGRAS